MFYCSTGLPVFVHKHWLISLPCPVVDSNVNKARSRKPIQWTSWKTQLSFGFISNRFAELNSVGLPFQFDIGKINTNSSHLNPESLDECNRLELIEQMKHPVDQAALIDEVKELVRNAYPDDVKNLDLNDDHIKKVLEWSLNRIANLNQLVDEKFSFLWILPEKSSHNLSKGKWAFPFYCSGNRLTVCLARHAAKTCADINECGQFR